MKNISELTTNFSSSLKDRVSNPFIFSFSFAYFLFHFDALIYLADSSDPTEELIRKFYLMLDLGPSSYWFSSFLWPFFIALFYTLAWPFIDGWISWARDKLRRIDVNRRQGINADSYVEQSEYDSLTSRFSELQKEVLTVRKQIEEAYSEKKLYMERINEIQQIEDTLRKKLGEQEIHSRNLQIELNSLNSEYSARDEKHSRLKTGVERDVKRIRKFLDDLSSYSNVNKLHEDEREPYSSSEYKNSLVNIIGTIGNGENIYNDLNYILNKYE